MFKDFNNIFIQNKTQLLPTCVQSLNKIGVYIHTHAIKKKEKQWVHTESVNLNQILKLLKLS